jgi:Uma2 family endonuclease
VQRAYTYTELLEFPEDNFRREIIDGELIVSGAPVTRHQAISIRLSAAIFNQIEATGGGHVFTAPLNVVLSPRDVVQPDLLVILDSQRDIIADTDIQGVPALLVEILSQPRMDRLRKRDLYARFAVPEYWILDPDADRVEVYRHDGTGFPKPQILERGDILEYGPLPGLRIDLSALFRE